MNGIYLLKRALKEKSSCRNYMKGMINGLIKYWIVLVLLFISQSVFSQSSALDKLFEKYEGKKGFTSVYISPYMFNMFKSMNSSDKDFDSLVKGLKSIRILSVDDPKAIPPGTDFYKEIINNLPENDYKELMVIKGKDQNVKFLIKVIGGKIVQLLLISGGSDNTFICIDGNLDINSIAKLSKTMNIQEMKPLENVKVNK